MGVSSVVSAANDGRGAAMPTTTPPVKRSDAVLEKDSLREIVTIETADLSWTEKAETVVEGKKAARR